MSSFSNSQDGGEINFDELIAALLDQESYLSPRYHYRLSGLESPETEQLAQAWPKIATERRANLLEDLETLSETNYSVLFDPVYEIALSDKDEKVRLIAVRALWETDNDDLIDPLLEMLQNDPSEIVRAQCASTLGIFVYYGEIEEIEVEQLTAIIDVMLDIMLNKQNAPLIRRRALEALGFSSHTSVPTMIAEAFDYGDEDWLASAMLAMGRSHDKQWHPRVMETLQHPNTQVRLQAVRAAGSLSIPDANLILIELLNDPEDEVRMAAVWSISELGDEEGENALLDLIERTEDEEEISLIEEALENLAFNSEMFDLNLFDLSEDDLEDMLYDSPDDAPDNDEE